jgi:F1F0 ATPase subunit 2
MIPLVAILAGLLVGVAYFAALRWAVGLYVAGEGWFGPVALTLGRFLGIAAFLAVAVRFGATALLAGSLGFLIARAIMVRAARRAG